MKSPFSSTQTAPWLKPGSTQARCLACSLALSDFADLHLVHSWEPLSPEIMRLWNDAGDAGNVGIIADQVKKEHLRHQEGFERLARQLRGWIGAETYDYLTPRLHLLQGTAQETIPALAARLKTSFLSVLVNKRRSIWLGIFSKRDRRWACISCSSFDNFAINITSRNQ